MRIISYNLRVFVSPISFKSNAENGLKVHQIKRKKYGRVTITKSMSSLALLEIKQCKKKNDNSSILFLNHVQDKVSCPEKKT